MRRAALLWGVFVLPGNGALFHAEAERVFPMNHTIHLKKQLRCIYLSNFFSGLRITDAVWVALLAARGFSLWRSALPKAFTISSACCARCPAEWPPTCWGVNGPLWRAVSWQC